jgi:chemotaxis protein MotB
MARRTRHEEHQNHEAWAIPYGDLVTLLLAFFVVMYSISTVNEGKYRAVSDALSAAFKGTPRTINPVEIGKSHTGAGAGRGASMAQNGLIIGEATQLVTPPSVAAASEDTSVTKTSTQHDSSSASSASVPSLSAMDEVVSKLEDSMATLVEQQQLLITRHTYGVEIELRTDILFPSGSATLSSSARAVLEKLADTLKPLPYPMRVEGHTDDRPINTFNFPSNWELSAARAASVVHLFTQRGMDASRLAVIGLGQFRPETDNATEAGRNANRRVVVVILSNGQNAEGATERKAADVLPSVVR